MTIKRTDEQIDKLLPEVLASQAIEGIELTGKEKELVRQRLRGDITELEFLERVLRG